MKMKYLFPLFMLAGSLLPTISMAAYDTTIAVDGSEVKDTVTGLIWRRCPEGMVWSSGTSNCTGAATVYTHESALTRAKAAAIASSPKAWRLPNIKELFSISQLGLSSGPFIDVAAFPSTPILVRFWSSSPYLNNLDFTWGVNFNNGYVLPSNRSDDGYVRLVR